MTDDRKKVTYDVFSDIVQKQAFMFTEPVDKAEVNPEDDQFIYLITTFKGEAGSGSLELATVDPFGLEIAANLLGCEPEDDGAAEHKVDSVKELLNITCGNLLTALMGDELIFDMKAPESLEMDRKRWGEFLEDVETISLLADDNPILIKLTM